MDTLAEATPVRIREAAQTMETAGRSAPAGLKTLKPCVLVVDDDADLCRVVNQILKGAGLRVETSTSATHAVRRIFDLHPDLLITDLRMPGLPGTDLCRVVRGTLELSRTKILAITGFHSAHSRWEAFDSGANEYLVKPFTTDEMRESVTRLLGLRAPPRWLAHGR